MSSWELSREQAAALLKYRCQLISFEGDLSDKALNAGEPSACLPILRYVFTHFSQSLDDFFRRSGHSFSYRMPDQQLVEAILGVWGLISPHAPLGGATIRKVLQKGAWGTDRLLFTLQCVLLCAQKHRDLIAKVEAAWLRDGINWTDTSPQQQFDTYPLIGTESERERTTYAWMAEAYREQMHDVPSAASSPAGSPDRRAFANGTAEQQKWIERILASAPSSPSSSKTTSSSSHYSSASSHAGHAGGARTPSPPPHGHAHAGHKYNDDQAKPSAARALQRPEAYAAYTEQLAEAGMNHITDSLGKGRGRRGSGGRAERARQAIAQRYNALMGSMKFGSGQDPLQEDDGFDDALFERAFIADSDSDASSPNGKRLSQSAPISNMARGRGRR